MICPHCGANNDIVIDSRKRKNGTQIRRRRKCLTCVNTFGTREIYDVDLFVHPSMGMIQQELTALIEKIESIKHMGTQL